MGVNVSCENAKYVYINKGIEWVVQEMYDAFEQVCRNGD